MSFPLNFGGPISGLICGAVFGFALERAGFASGCKMTAQLRFTDWGVFKVMFTAILVSAIGIQVLDTLGIMSTYDIFIPTTYFWATLLGGVGVGAGMAIGGYCPGTCVVSFMSGRLDGLMFFVGIVAGTIGFAGAYDALLPMLKALPGPEAQTVSELLNVPDWVVLLGLIAVYLGVSWFTRGPVQSCATPTEPQKSAQRPTVAPVSQATAT